MYKSIEVFETDFYDKYLIINNDKSFYGGFLIKDIVELLKTGINYKEITEKLSLKYNNNFDEEMINNIIVEKINPLLKKDKYRGFKKIFIILNPSKISIPTFIEKLLINKYFYFYLIISFLINVAFFYELQKSKIVPSFFEQIIFYLLLFIVLISHELGHSFSAKLFNVNVREIGFAIYHVFPVFYVNLNESWKLDKKKRMIINLSGIYFQLIIGVVLIIVLHYFYDSIVLENLYKLNLLIVIYNLNPFIRFDGYWVLSDILNENNLNKKSNEILASIFKFKNPKSSIIIIIYALLKLIFYFWIFYYFITFISDRINHFIMFKGIEVIDIIVILIMFFIINNIFLNKLIKSKK